jgi:two-component system phosphate regulon response regulator OmpR
MAKILIVDDDTRILALLKQFLTQNGYSASTATDALEAEEMMKHTNFDLIILDVMMPKVTGLEFSSKIKKLQNIPIILLTALNKVEDRIKGLEARADDYLSKPFEPKELLLRMQNLLQLYTKQKSDKVTGELVLFGHNSYNLTNKEFKKNGQITYLTSSEQKLLEIFIMHKNQPLSRQQILQEVDHVSVRSIDVQVVRLRAKIETDPSKPQFLQTIRNGGYALYI